MPTVEPFDAVAGAPFLQHLDLRPALGILHQLLNPGGNIAVAGPKMLNPEILLQKNIPRLKDKPGASPDETAFVRGSLRKELQA